MASTRLPRDSQISWPVPISVATATKRRCSCSMLTDFRRRLQDIRQLLAVDQTGAGEIEVEEAQHPAPRQVAGELFESVQLAGDVAAADHRADRGAGDDVGMDARLVERLKYADVRPAASRAAAERQTDLAITHCRGPYQRKTATDRASPRPKPISPCAASTIAARD